MTWLHDMKNGKAMSMKEFHNLSLRALLSIYIHEKWPVFLANSYQIIDYSMVKMPE